MMGKSPDHLSWEVDMENRPVIEVSEGTKVVLATLKLPKSLWPCLCKSLLILIILDTMEGLHTLQTGSNPD